MCVEKKEVWIAAEDIHIHVSYYVHLIHSLNGVDDWGRVCHASGFQQDGIELVSALGKLAKSTDQISSEGATNAAIVHCDEIFRIDHRLGN